jgi:hypothetical protein
LTVNEKVAEVDPGRIPKWQRARMNEGIRRIGRGNSEKFMITVASSVLDALQAEADKTGVSIQEQIRLVLGNWKESRLHTERRKP